jgi:hypothetical protein
LQITIDFAKSQKEICSMIIFVDTAHLDFTLQLGGEKDKQILETNKYSQGSAFTQLKARDNKSVISKLPNKLVLLKQVTICYNFSLYFTFTFTFQLLLM